MKVNKSTIVNTISLLTMVGCGTAAALVTAKVAAIVLVSFALLASMVLIVRIIKACKAQKAPPKPKMRTQNLPIQPMNGIDPPPIANLSIGPWANILSFLPDQDQKRIPEVCHQFNYRFQHTQVQASKMDQKIVDKNANKIFKRISSLSSQICYPLDNSTPCKTDLWFDDEGNLTMASYEDYNQTLVLYNERGTVEFIPEISEHVLGKQLLEIKGEDKRLQKELTKKERIFRAYEEKKGGLPFALGKGTYHINVDALYEKVGKPDIRMTITNNKSQEKISPLQINGSLLKQSVVGRFMDIFRKRIGEVKVYTKKSSYYSEQDLYATTRKKEKKQASVDFSTI